VSAAVADGRQIAGEHVVLPAATSEWRDGPPGMPPGGKFAVISGNPREPGRFTMRVELPAGYVLAPYRVASDESMVVLAGSLQLGSGTMFDPSTLQTLDTGAFVTLRANRTHFVSTKQGAVVQICGNGPFAIEYVAPGSEH